jgi:hypothetical protein
VRRVGGAAKFPSPVWRGMKTRLPFELNQRAEQATRITLAEVLHTARPKRRRLVLLKSIGEACFAGALGLLPAKPCFARPARQRQRQFLSSNFCRV